MNLFQIYAGLMMTAIVSPALAGPTAKLDNFAHQALNLASYKWAEFDLNDDGQPEQFLYANDPKWCGSGGCTLFILQTQGNSFRPVLRAAVAQLPISVSRQRTNGWHDLAVTIGGGGERAATVRLSYNGRKYPNNPTLAPRMPDTAEGLKVLIAQ